MAAPLRYRRENDSLTSTTPGVPATSRSDNGRPARNGVLSTSDRCGLPTVKSVDTGFALSAPALSIVTGTVKPVMVGS